MKALVCAVLLCLSTVAVAQTSRIAPHAKIYIGSDHGFETYLAAALAKKDVPVVIVSDKTKADYVLSSTIMPNDRMRQPSIVVNTAVAGSAGEVPTPTSLSISVSDIHTSEVVYAYTYGRGGYTISLQSGAESCAKHLKKFIEKGDR